MVLFPVNPPGLAKIPAGGNAVTSMRNALDKASQTTPFKVLIVLRLKNMVVVNVPGSYEEELDPVIAVYVILSKEFCHS